MPTVIASAKGQIVIPKKEREKVGIKPGLPVVVQAVGDHIEIRPLPENPVDYFCGIFKGGPSLTRALLQDPQEEMNREKKGRWKDWLASTGREGGGDRISVFYGVM